MSANPSPNPNPNPNSELLDAREAGLARLEPRDRLGQRGARGDEVAQVAPEARALERRERRERHVRVDDPVARAAAEHLGPAQGVITT